MEVFKVTKKNDPVIEGSPTGLTLSRKILQGLTARTSIDGEIVVVVTVTQIRRGEVKLTMSAPGLVISRHTYKGDGRDE